MKKHLVTGVTVVAVLGLASLAFAGDFHYNQNLVCSDCHVMHAQQSHGNNPNGSGNYITPVGTHHYLLRNEINELCLSCHDGVAWAPDVFEGHTNGYVRQAGALNEEGGNGLYPPPTGHTLNSTAVAPGSSPAWSNTSGLNCVDCHAPHGRTQSGVAAPGGYRNLFGPVGVTIQYSRGDVAPNTNDLTKWVFEDASSGTNANHYGYNHVTFNEPDQTASKYADFCKQCHTNFHGAVGGAEIGGTGTPAAEFIRHPAAGVNIGAIGGGHSNLPRFIAEGANQLQAMSPTGKRHGSYTASDTELTPSCMSCHKGHGNQNAFGLIYMVGTGAIGEEGDDGVDMRNTCRACHTQGGANTFPW